MSMPQRRSTYQPLIDSLAMQTSSPVTYTFAEIAAVLGRPLPVQAHIPRWWRDPQRLLARDLVAAGWAVDTTELWRDRVTFTRVPTETETSRPDTTA